MINKLFLKACGYTVLILTLFYLFAAISQFTSQSIPPEKFALILLFGFVISVAELMYERINIKKVYRCLIHYAVLLLAFCLIFIFAGNISLQRPAAVFLSIVIFTVLYFFIYAIVYLVRRTINATDDSLESKVKSSKTNNKGSYRSLYGDSDK